MMLQIKSIWKDKLCFSNLRGKVSHKDVFKNKCLEGLSKTHRKTLLLLNFTKNKTILNSYPHRVCNKSIFLGINQCPHSNPHSKVCTICSKQYGVCSVMKHLLVKIFRKRIWKNDLLLSLYSAKSKLLSKTSARIFSRK